MAVQMPRGVPIYLTYLTAHPTETGQLAFVKDVYGWDKPGAQVASTYISPATRAAN
jgi:murein L,D-transpeptidase YcbB/YkuD